MSKKETDRGEGKTATIKKRRVEIYLPTVQTLERWKKLASDQHLPLSKFVFEHVEESLKNYTQTHNQIVLLERIKTLEQENKQLHQENRMKTKAIENLEVELQHLRRKAFTQLNYTGIRQYEKELIQLLQTRKQIQNDELLRRLNINPTNIETVKAITRQLDNLEAYGLIKPIPGGWKWINK